MWKMANFWPKPWSIKPLWKNVNISTFWTIWVFLALKGLFSVYNIVKHIFLAYIAYKKDGRMASFLPKPLIKNHFFDFSNFLS